MEKSTLPEFWQRGPVEGVPDLLQPAAHALLQAREEIIVAMDMFRADLIWAKPAEVASVAFHLQHIPGVIDRLFTYAEGNSLSPAQFDDLAREGRPDESVLLPDLIRRLDVSITAAVERLKQIQPGELGAARYAGRKRIPTTVIGLLFHAAEHTMRHTGQLIVTARFLLAEHSKQKRS